MRFKNKGFSLIEVLIATAVLSVVGLGAFQFLGQANKTYAKIDDTKLEKLLQLRLMRILEDEAYCKEILTNSKPNLINLNSSDVSIPAKIINEKFSNVYNIGISFSEKNIKNMASTFENSTLKNKNLTIEHDLAKNISFTNIKLLKNTNFAAIANQTPNGQPFSINIPALFELKKQNSNKAHYSSRSDRPIPLTLVFQKSPTGLVLTKCFSRGSRSLVAGTQICNSLGGYFDDSRGCLFKKFKGTEPTFEKNIRFQNLNNSQMDFQKYICDLDKKVVRYEKQSEPAIYGTEINLLKAKSNWVIYRDKVFPYLIHPFLVQNISNDKKTTPEIIPARPGNPKATTSYCSP